MTISQDELQALTEEYGGKWGVNHSMRLLKLISAISAGIQNDKEIMMIAAYLHDWGAYPPWAEKGIDHAVKSKSVAHAFLRERAYDPEKAAKVIECIEYHHTATSKNSIEAILLSDADTLDFFGAVGVLREFSRHPKDMRESYNMIIKRRNELPQRLVLGQSIEFARNRLQFMDQILKNFEEDTFGLF